MCYLTVFSNRCGAFALCAHYWFWFVEHLFLPLSLCSFSCLLAATDASGSRHSGIMDTPPSLFRRFFLFCFVLFCLFVCFLIPYNIVCVFGHHALLKYCGKEKTLVKLTLTKKNPKKRSTSIRGLPLPCPTAHSDLLFRSFPFFF